MKVNKKRNRFFTLLEVILGMGLALLIFSLLFGAYFQAERVSSFWQTQERKAFLERNVGNRLEEIFLTVGKVDQKKTFFFTDKEASFLLPGTTSLIFTYNNGAVQDPNLSGEVLGRVYVNEAGDLTLMTFAERSEWHAGEIPPFHVEVLLTQVASLQWEFFQVAEDKEPKWIQGSWSKDNLFSPAAIKMDVTLREGTVMRFLFMVPENLAVFTLK